MESQAIRPMLDELAKSYDDDSLKDFTIICGSQEIKVHRFVLTLHSPVFRKAVQGDFMEAKDRRIDLSDHEPSSVKCLVHYLYHLDYLPCPRDEDFTLYHVQMCILADKYMIEPLKEKAIAAVEERLYHDPLPDGLAEAIELAYGSPAATERIRDIIVKHGVNSGIVIPKGEESTAPLHEAFTNIPDFATDCARALNEWVKELAQEKKMIRASYGGGGETRLYQCSWCRAVIMAAILDTAEEYFCFHCSTGYSGRHWRLQVVTDG